MKATKAGNLVIACEHWKTWPPITAWTGSSAEELRKQGVVSDVEVQRIQVWERVCGLKEMDEGKCMTCPHVRKLTTNHLGTFMTTLDGHISSKISESPTNVATDKAKKDAMVSTLRPDGTPHSKTQSAWVKNANEGKPTE